MEQIATFLSLSLHVSSPDGCVRSRESSKLSLCLMRLEMWLNNPFDYETRIPRPPSLGASFLVEIETRR